jgi:PRC-barrel domain
MGRNLNRYLDGTAAANVDAERPPLIKEMLYSVSRRFAGYLLVILGSALAFIVWATFYTYVWPGKPPAVSIEAPPPVVVPDPSPPAVPVPPAVRPTEIGPAISQVPSDALPHLWKLPVYDPSNAKVGQIEDVLISKNGAVIGYIVGVGGGFLGGQGKNIAVPFKAVGFTMKDGSTFPVLYMTKDAVQSAPKQTFDQYKMKWVPDPTEGGAPAFSPQPAR